MRLLGLRLPEAYCAVIIVAMPPSWSARKRAQMQGTEHRQKPDGSNLIKAIEDHLSPRDEIHHDGRWIKRWGLKNRLVIVDTSRHTITDEDVAAWVQST